jgi:hypothetical protein
LVPQLVALAFLLVAALLSRVRGGRAREDDDEAQRDRARGSMHDGVGVREEGLRAREGGRPAGMRRRRLSPRN